ncbi:hypothetical protein DXV76_03805 [Rhodobacteraceae bacterium CCMM004]|nr:hypothetical protein DXV76_03805 [Rhodobacteraceae bacterium CCMM004]
MFTTTPQTFDQRRISIQKRARKLSRGSVATIGADGLIIARPRRHGSGFPWGTVVAVAGVLLLAKAVMLTHVGPTAYDESVAMLAGGTVVEQAGAWVMQADALTVWLSEQIASLLR